jgi:hypothetical protein
MQLEQLLMQPQLDNKKNYKSTLNPLNKRILFYFFLHIR